MLLLVLASFALHFDRRPRHLAFGAVPDTVLGLAGTVVVFAVGGFGLTRLLLPERLRRYELLWVLPTGACAIGLSMTVLGWAGAPFPVSLTVVLAAGAGLAVHAGRRLGLPAVDLQELAWPVFLAGVVFFLALIPMLFGQHYAAVTGTGSDAHVAAGTANFLEHAYPTAIKPGLPIDRMPPLWGSKFPIYYAFAAVSTVSTLQTWQVMPILIAAMLAMAAAGIFLVVREVLGAPRAVACAAMALAGCNRMVLHTGLNPYFNQTWGYFAMPFSLVLGWWTVQPQIAGRARRTSFALLAGFLIVLIFAYPLAAPIPLAPIAYFLWSEHRRRAAAGEKVFRVRDLYSGRRSLIWLIPLCFLMAIPLGAVLGKVTGAIGVLAPGHSLAAWGGDLRAFIPFNFFLNAPDDNTGNLIAFGTLFLAYRGLRGQPKPIAWGLGGLLVIGVLMAAYLRHRAYGFYFHFKLLAFVGPLIVAFAAVGAARLKRYGPACIAVFAISAAISAYNEIAATGYQLPKTAIALQGWAAKLPQHASIRLDMWPPQQLWAAYMLAVRPLCSQKPLLGTDYPHVPTSRKADYIVVSPPTKRPVDAVGPALQINLDFALYRENPAVPGVSRCSLERKGRLFNGADHSS